MSSPPDNFHRFGPFELDVRAGTLARAGRRVALPRQSVQLLQALVARPGEVITRDEIARLLWPDGTHVDFDHGINNAAARLRRALGDSSSTPRFIETLPRVGYRFVALLADPAAAGPDAGAVPPASRRGRRARWIPAAAAAVLLAAYGAGVATGVFVAGSNTMEARAQAERSLVHTRLVLDGALPADLAYPAAMGAAASALALDRRLADAHLAAGYAALWGRWDWTAAGAHFREAVDRDPQLARARQGHALWLAGRGRPAEAVAEIAHARRLDPDSAEVAYDAALLSFVAGRTDASVEILADLLGRQPNDARAHELMSETLASAGRNADAARHFYRFLVLVDVNETDAREATAVLATGGMASLIRRNLERPSGKPLDRHGVPFKLASNYAQIGDVDDALAWLQRAADQRDSRLLLVNVHPRFAAVREDPRFRTVLAAIGL